ncbi:ATP-grasp domain-containing protein [Pirellulaceae bacterium SH449]
MKVTVLEYLCGGGLMLPDPSTQSSIADNELGPLLREGEVMWRALVDDLMLGGHDVVSLLDRRLENRFRPLGAKIDGGSLDLITFDERRSLNCNWEEACDGADRVVVIAPEIDGHLLDIVENVRRKRHVVVASSSYFLKTASDKWLTYKALGQHISQPRTTTGDQIRNGWPDGWPESSSSGWVLKPRDGAGCSGIFRCKEERTLKEHIARLDEPSKWIVQEWIEGRHCSAAVIIDENGTITFLGGTEQMIEMDDTTPKYVGAKGPLRGASVEGLADWCNRILSLLPGAFGWVGFDYIEVPSSCGEAPERVLIEINPRLTTSYLLYRQLLGPRLGDGVIGLPVVEIIKHEPNNEEQWVVRVED